MAGPYRGDQAAAMRRKAELAIPAPPAWQDIDRETDRMRVPGGWLYRTIVYHDEAVAVATCFVPAEPGGGWW